MRSDPEQRLPVPDGGHICLLPPVWVRSCSLRATGSNRQQAVGGRFSFASLPGRTGGREVAASCLWPGNHCERWGAWMPVVPPRGPKERAARGMCAALAEWSGASARGLAPVSPWEARVGTRLGGGRPNQRWADLTCLDRVDEGRCLPVPSEYVHRRVARGAEPRSRVVSAVVGEPPHDRPGVPDRVVLQDVGNRIRPLTAAGKDDGVGQRAAGEPEGLRFVAALGKIRNARIVPRATRETMRALRIFPRAATNRRPSGSPAALWPTPSSLPAAVSGRMRFRTSCSTTRSGTPGRSWEGSPTIAETTRDRGSAPRATFPCTYSEGTGRHPR